MTLSRLTASSGYVKADARVRAASRRLGIFRSSLGTSKLPNVGHRSLCSPAASDCAMRLGAILTGKKQGVIVSLGFILVIVVVILLLGGFSGRFGGYGYGYGHGGVGILGTILIIVLVLMLLGRI